MPFTVTAIVIFSACLVEGYYGVADRVDYQVGNIMLGVAAGLCTANYFS